ncbi:MopE-related protein [Polyangium aurulentum]|uniref:MopE-related protein n=1 Tax=Polyangium aurulentum TaxID=2567896 RepID=UPI0010ADD6D0|nr:MopE-related protein [Polyangium aurulentum]UQA54924.1 MSCRAMM family adhesin SdrC [Polyangium aurulentum]
MARIQFRTCRSAGGVALLSGLSGLLVTTAARAQVYPVDDAAWMPLMRTDPVTQVTAPIGDAAGDAPGPRDAVGNAEFPMAYIQSDSTHLYFRLRINQQVRQNGTNFTPYGWGCIIDTDGDGSDYEFLALVDGVANPDTVRLQRNTAQAKPNDPADSPEVLLRAYLAPLVMGQPGFGYAREIPAGANFPIDDKDPDFFIDWAVERGALLDAGIGALTPLRIACGTSAMGDVLSTDLHGPAHLPDLFGDFILCGDAGCGAQNCAGVGAACSAGVGGCATAGTIVCDASGQPVCNAVAAQPSVEVCDGIDNDCDSETDEGNPGGGVACSSGLPGICATGQTVCVENALACHPSIAAGEYTETCNGLDDDCNGIPDDGPAGGGEPCTTGLLGACATGHTACGGGANTCVPAAAPGEHADTCNGVDDDCDGQADEDFDLGAACAVGIGACASEGVLACDAQGGASCSAAPGMPSPESCGDAIDSDCDGNLDNDCPDTDDDGLPDHTEVDVGADPNDADTDDDGVRDGLEPDWDEDTDGDGHINVLDPDSDGDGLFDGTETGFDCSGPGTDASAGHCTPDADSGVTVTDPLDVDTDDGSVSDGDEDTDKDGAVDPGERDPLDPSDDLTTPCADDARCGDGQICVDGACVDGCRGEGGPGCASDEQCTSSGTEPGVCVPADVVAPHDAFALAGGGCACTTGSSEDTPGRTAWALAALGALIIRRKRR